MADGAKFVVVAHPDGVGRAWNVGGCCGRPGRENIDDAGFINAVVDDIAGHVTIDPKRRYATGISNGGMLAYALACNTGTFAAIGSDSATQLDKCAAPHPTSAALRVERTQRTGHGDGDEPRLQSSQRQRSAARQAWMSCSRSYRPHT